MPGEVEMVGNELRNVVAYWRGRFADATLRFPLPSSLTWTFQQGLIVEGQALGVWNWPDASTTPFFAPVGCHGAIVDTGDQLVTALFHREPAQLLLRFTTAIVTPPGPPPPGPPPSGGLAAARSIVASARPAARRPRDRSRGRSRSR